MYQMVNQMLKEHFNPGQGLINKTGTPVKEEIIHCVFCDYDFPKSETVEVNFYRRKVRACLTCNDELHTCIVCGEKILKSEDSTTTSEKEHVHIDCI